MATIHFDDLRLDLPAAADPVAGQGVDSATTTWESGGLSVVVDRGPFADRLERPAGEIRHEVVDGMPLRLRSFVTTDGTPVAVAHLPRLATTVVIRGGPGSDPETPLRVLRTLRPVNRGHPDAARDQGDRTP